MRTLTKQTQPTQPTQQILRAARPIKSPRSIKQSWLEQPTPRVAQYLLGKAILFGRPGQKSLAVITEVEAYGSADDPASHAHRGPTKRSRVMFGPAGRLYVYFVYGMHHCLNIVTEPKGVAGAVLIRGVYLGQRVISGPGRVARVMGLRRVHSGLNCLAPGARWRLVDVGLRPLSKQIEQTARVGIAVGRAKRWRWIWHI
ncbi:MAG: DNA-3-methyladenine glycosylase [Parcubacteria group bacterium]